jgi:hypothetical protein
MQGAQRPPAALDASQRTWVKSTLIWLNSEPVMKLAKNTMMTWQQQQQQQKTHKKHQQRQQKQQAYSQCWSSVSKFHVITICCAQSSMCRV